MIAVNRIKYSNFSSIDLDLIVDVSFDSDNGEMSTYLNREAIASESYRGEFKRVYGYKYNEVFSPKFTFIKNNFEDFSITDVRRVLSWLTSKQTASFCSVYYDDSEVIAYEILGAFTEINTYKLANNRTVGITATFESITPYAFSPLKTVTKDISNPEDNTITIKLATDEPNSPVYPRITLKQDSSTNVITINHAMTDADNWIEGSVFYFDGHYYWVGADGVKYTRTTNDSNIETMSMSITNVYRSEDGASYGFDTVVKNNIKNETVVLDGANKIVSSSRNNGRIFGDDFDWQWIPLYEGVNELSFIGNGVVTIEWREPIKCGEF